MPQLDPFYSLIDSNDPCLATCSKPSVKCSLPVPRIGPISNASFPVPGGSIGLLIFAGWG